MVECFFHHRFVRILWFDSVVLARSVESLKDPDDVCIRFSIGINRVVWREFDGLGLGLGLGIKRLYILLEYTVVRSSRSHTQVPSRPGPPESSRRSPPKKKIHLNTQWMKK